MISSVYDFWQALRKTVLASLTMTLMIGLIASASIATAATTSKPASTHKDWKLMSMGQDQANNALLQAFPKALKGIMIVTTVTRPVCI